MSQGKKRVLCYGDSLTWGWTPMETGVPTERYPFDVRWTGVMANLLGERYEIIEEGLSGRTTNIDDPTDPRLNGAAYLPSCLATHLPLDLVVLMLGTNDTKIFLNRSPYETALGIAALITQINQSAGGVGTAYPAPAILLLIPPPLGRITHPWFAEMFRGGKEKSEQFAGLFKTVASVYGVPFVDAGDLLKTGGVDGIHFTVENNAVFGKAVAEKIKSIFG